MENACKPHVLAVPFPGQGHINPMLQFSKLLVSKGIKVTFAITLFTAKSMQTETGLVNIELFSDGCDEGGILEAGSLDAYFERFKTIGSENLAKVIERQESSDFPFKCLMYDSCMPWCLDIAKELGLVGVSFYTQSCSVNVIYYHVYHGLLSTPVQGVSAVSMPGMPLLEISDLPTFLLNSESNISYLKFVADQFSNIDQADWLVFNTFHKLENEVVNWMLNELPTRTITVGPTLPSKYLDKRGEGDDNYGINLIKPDRRTCINWLDTKKTGSVVYVSFGSFLSLQEQQMEEIAWGLEKSGKYFLWVVRAEEEQKLPSKFREEYMSTSVSLPDKGLIVKWSLQLQVLAHPSVGCFITHAGWNSTLEGLSLGVPMVGIPIGSDQTTNIKFVEDVWRVGVRGKVDEKGIIRREEIERCIREITEGEHGEDMRRNVEKWKELAKEAVDEGGSSSKNIQHFVDSLLCS
ncbi:hypothetical protein GIB67_025344 [Kingdonia uniflora]|uniref:Glycosyltransferase n=1 Tax=Kingdonia uniflora TaxID=39325 RepID=A0A7J7NCE4_9MAGN|nr:hypothetical protein GIB67_025344 [Kingdonia uniflora]